MKRFKHRNRLRTSVATAVAAGVSGVAGITSGVLSSLSRKESLEAANKARNDILNATREDAQQTLQYSEQLFTEQKELLTLQGQNATDQVDNQIQQALILKRILQKSIILAMLQAQAKKFNLIS